jgi:hypothetical protein
MRYIAHYNCIAFTSRSSHTAIDHSVFWNASTRQHKEVLYDAASLQTALNHRAASMRSAPHDCLGRLNQTGCGARQRTVRRPQQTASTLSQVSIDCTNLCLFYYAHPYTPPKEHCSPSSSSISLRSDHILAGHDLFSRSWRRNYWCNG